ncbi:MAG: hypothetical protein JW973_06920 [Bacteroidales bacterium]|nr:hypothetical protein [Bacteroidales bacterium]
MHVLTHNPAPLKRIFTFFFFFAFFGYPSQSQKPMTLPHVEEIRWELDYDVYLRMTNDSAYTYDIRELFHVKDEKLPSAGEFILYPVNLGEDYVYGIAALNQEDSGSAASFKTLWSALHDAVGGGWVHFNNCLLYAMETRYLQLTAPLMKRPVTRWKPDPVTESWLRTKRWKYYVPVDKKKAKKEYNIRMKNNELGDIKSIPSSFINLFLATSNGQYRALKKAGESKKVAQIDLVKLMLGINYLGEPQILYIRSAVLNAIKNYSANKLPTVVIFDPFDAAAVMSLNQEGYQIDAIAFRNTKSLTVREADEKKLQIQSIIDEINAYNRSQFMKRLDHYYNP